MAFLLGGCLSVILRSALVTVRNTIIDTKEIDSLNGVSYLVGKDGRTTVFLQKGNLVGEIMRHTQGIPMLFRLTPGFGMSLEMACDKSIAKRIVNYAAAIVAMTERNDESTEFRCIQCLICYTNKARLMITPCGHIPFCFSCARDMFLLSLNRNANVFCPLCRMKVEGLKIIFYS